MQKRKNYTMLGEFLGQTKSNCDVSGNRMKRERKLAAVLGLALILGMTGCAGTEEVSGDALEETGVQGDGETGGGPEETQEGENSANAPAAQESEWEREEPVPASRKEPEDEGQIIPVSQGTEHLSGKVQNPQTDGMILAQTTLMDEDGQVTLLDVKDAKKISVKFTEDAKVEYWRIQGGGAGIDMQDAEVSDLKEGMSVELEGYYDGEVFMATRIIMEEDV